MNDRKQLTEEQIDEALEESFPASDPPAFGGSDAPQEPEPGDGKKPGTPGKKPAKA